jgi:Plavaka transposase
MIIYTISYKFSQNVDIPLGLTFCKITTLIRDKFEGPMFTKFHLSPFKLFCKHPYQNKDERIYSEMTDSDVFINEHDKVQCAPTDDPPCKCEKVIAALMFWSDATHLATFGTAKVWPIYMLFGNMSKYVRCQPNSGATKHVVYIWLEPFLAIV